MATIKQERAFANTVVNGGNVTQAMKDAGYAPATVNTPSKLTASVAWEQMLAEIDEKPLLDKLREISLNGKSDTGCISAIKEILSLKNRYPDKHLRINSLKATVTDVLIPD